MQLKPTAPPGFQKLYKRVQAPTLVARLYPYMPAEGGVGVSMSSSHAAAADCEWAHTKVQLVEEGAIKSLFYAEPLHRLSEILLR